MVKHLRLFLRHIPLVVYPVSSHVSTRENYASKWNEPRGNVSDYEYFIFLVTFLFIFGYAVKQVVHIGTKLTLRYSAGACGITRTVVLSKLNVFNYTRK